MDLQPFAVRDPRDLIPIELGDRVVLGDPAQTVSADELVAFIGAHRSGEEDLAEALDALIADELFTA
jgi:hypothetical protein